MERRMQLGRTMCFLVIGNTSIIHILTARTRRSAFHKGWFKSNPRLVVATGAMLLLMSGLTLLPIMRDVSGGIYTNFLGFTTMSIYHWLIAIGLSVVPLIVAEYEKFWENYKLKIIERNRVRAEH
jgi:magnesium-transporting ATPase (P-type)